MSRDRVELCRETRNAGGTNKHPQVSVRVQHVCPTPAPAVARLERDRRYGRGNVHVNGRCDLDPGPKRRRVGSGPQFLQLALDQVFGVFCITLGKWSQSDSRTTLWDDHGSNHSIRKRFTET
jgi:hypothetical protein